MRPTLEALRRARRASPRSVERFLAAHEFPLVDAEGVTFVWRGRAHAVRLRTWVRGMQDSLPLTPVGATDLWALRVEIPRGSRIEYKYEVVDAKGKRWITDPLNPHRAADPFGENSVCRAHGYERPRWTLPEPGVPEGRVDVIPIAAPGADVSRTLAVWLPPRFSRTRRYPLLVAHDGGDLMRYAAFSTVLGQLTHRLEIPELVVALHEPEERNEEYAVSDAHARFLSGTLVPALEKRFPLDANRALLGASLGAVASLHTAWRAPERWTQLALLSGSFAFSDIGPHRRDALFDPIVRFVNAFRRDPRPLAARWYLACGRYESLIDENRAMAALLSAHGVDFRFDEVPDGHHWECWRDRLRDALGFLLAGPLWMVYE